MKKYIVIFDFKLYDERLLVEAKSKENAIQKAEAILERRWGHEVFWYNVNVEEA